jgi:hypothetical protein
LYGILEEEIVLQNYGRQRMMKHFEFDQCLDIPEQEISVNCVYMMKILRTSDTLRENLSEVPSKNGHVTTMSKHVIGPLSASWSVTN